MKQFTMIWRVNGSVRWTSRIVAAAWLLGVSAGELSQAAPQEGNPFAADAIRVDLALVAEARAVGPEAEAGDPRVAAMLSQFEPILKVELSFANRACQWSDDQRAAAVAAAKQFRLDYARRHARDGGRVNVNGRIVIAGGRGGAQMFGQVVGGDGDFEEGLAKALRQEMTDDQRDAYDAERAKRKEFYTAAAIDNIVAQIDQNLGLTPEQRAQITESLSENWQYDWTPPLQMFVQLSQYIPDFPERHVVVHLTPEQRVAWNQLQKISVRRVAFGGDVFGGGEARPIDDIDLGDR